MSGIEDLARKGRNGDNTLMHVSTDEVAGLNSLARSMMGRELTQNPDTGLPEAFLFAPLLAPMAASGLGLGGGALATGLLAGGLGAAEAELRGMDDPLERGLYSGLTAGALSGVGNALSGAGEAGQAAGQAGQAGSQAATTSAPDLGEAVRGAGAGGGAGTGFSVTNPSAGSPSFSGAGDLSLAGQSAAPQASTTSLAGSNMAQVPGEAGQTMSSVSAPGEAAGQFPSGGNLGVTNPSAPTQSPLGQYGDIPQMAEGAKNIFTDTTGEAGRQFMSQAQMPLAAGAAGLGGQAQMRARDEMKERSDKAKAESAADRRQAENQIRSSYAAVGRPMPTPIGGGSLFQQGGIVGLRRGGQVGGPGGGSDPGNRGGGSSGGSSGGSRGGGGSSHPGRPGGESGERSMSRGGGSGAAVQQPAQPKLDPQKIEDAVIGPMDRFTQGIKDLAMLSPTAQLMSHLTRDRRALGGSSGHGPGAPGAGRARNPGLEAGKNGPGGASPEPIIPPQVAPEPTTPTMRTEPSQTRNMFLDELQQGAGNRMAMQNTGYRGAMSMAEGGYLDGGMLPGDGMSDDVPASIDGEQPAALSSGEFVIPADVVSHIGNGSSDSGAKELYAMMDRIRRARTGEDDQAPPVNARKMMPK